MLDDLVIECRFVDDNKLKIESANQMITLPDL